MNDNEKQLLEYISGWPKWKLDALMLDESDLEIRKRIERYISEKNGGIDRMSMISEQVKYLREFDCFGTVKQAMNEVADTIESLSAKLADMERSAEDCDGEWIPCKDRLPETRNNILVCQSDGYVSVGYYSWDRAFLDLNSIPFGDVIAWCELPEPYHEP